MGSRCVYADIKTTIKDTMNLIKTAVPVEIKLNEAEVGDTIRVMYVEQNDPEIPDSSATEIMYTGVVHRLTTNGKHVGAPIIRLRNFNEGRWGHANGYTELSLATAHTLPPATVTLLNRPEKPFKLANREYYVTKLNSFSSTVHRITVKGFEAVQTYTYNFYEGYWTEHTEQITTEELVEIILGKSPGNKILTNPPIFRTVLGTEYVAETRDPNKALTIRFNFETEWETFEGVDPQEVLTGTGPWHYPKVYVNPRQAIIDRAKSMGVLPGNIYGCFGREKYGVDAEGYTLYSSLNGCAGERQYELHRIQQDPMLILEGIEKGYLVLERTAE